MPASSLIEKEKSADDDDAIKLRDQDFAPSGNLIDYREPRASRGEARPLEPSRHTLRELENEKFDPSVKNVKEMKSDSSVRDARILGAYISVEETTGSIRSQSDHSIVAEGDASFTHAPIPMPAHPATNTSDDNSDNESGGWVQMVDHENDDDMKIMEPQAMDD